MAGRRSKYNEVKERFEEIKKWCSIGATDKEIAANLGIHLATFYDYKNKKPEFSELLKAARRKPVEEIKAALFKKAIGFEYVEGQVTTDKDGRKTKTVYKKQALPDATAAMMLLKHWAKDEGWTSDPQMLDLKKEELQLRRELADDWD